MLNSAPANTSIRKETILERTSFGQLSEITHAARARCGHLHKPSGRSPTIARSEWTCSLEVSLEKTAASGFLPGVAAAHWRNAPASLPGAVKIAVDGPQVWSRGLSENRSGKKRLWDPLHATDLLVSPSPTRKQISWANFSDCWTRSHVSFGSGPCVCVRAASPTSLSARASWTLSMVVCIGVSIPAGRNCGSSPSALCPRNLSGPSERPCVLLCHMGAESRATCTNQRCCSGSQGCLRHRHVAYVWVRIVLAAVLDGFALTSLGSLCQSSIRMSLLFPCNPLTLCLGFHVLPVVAVPRRACSLLLLRRRC